MENNIDAKSILNLDRLVFDTIQFSRKGFKNDNALEIQLEANISQKNEQEVYRVSLLLKGDKPEEYNFEICLTGYFSFDCKDNLKEEQKQILVSKNTLSILMPYLRSQVSLLTAQPEMDCVVLPPFNIGGMVDGNSGSK